MLALLYYEEPGSDTIKGKAKRACMTEKCILNNFKISTVEGLVDRSKRSTNLLATGTSMIM